MWGTGRNKSSFGMISGRCLKFNISDFNVPGKAFGEAELYEAIDRGAIQILDDATIADMKAKRARDKERDKAETERRAIEAGEMTDWRKAMAEWGAPQAPPKEGMCLAETS